jgi:hypothetical protein
MKKIYYLIILIFVLSYSNLKSQTATFDITYTGFSAQQEIAIDYAAKKWGHIVVSPIPIKVVIHNQVMTPGQLGITFPNGRLNFAGAPMADTWFVTSLANAITGTELNPGEADMEIYLNSTMVWHNDTSGIIPMGSYDLVSVAMHEIGHGLGFLGIAKVTGSDGSFGTIQASDFGGLTTSFPWPDLDTLPDVFDRMLVNSLGQQLDTFTNPSTALGDEFTSDNIFFNGPLATIGNGGYQPKIYAPSSFALGSSMTHLDETTYPIGNPNEMMTPNATPGHAHHDPGPVCRGVLMDIGWTINPGVGIAELNNSENNLIVYPTPSSEQIFFLNSGNDKIKTIEVINLYGEIVLTVKNFSDKSIDVNHLTSGLYFLRVVNENRTLQKSFVKL